MLKSGETDVLNRARKYAAQVQELTRSEELFWYGERLGINDHLLLELIGYTPSAIVKMLAVGATPLRLAEVKPDGTLWVTELFREMVARNGYDVKRAATAFRGLIPETEEEVDALITAAKPWKKVPSLLRKIRAGGPTVLDDLTEFVRLRNVAGKNLPPRTKG